MIIVKNLKDSGKVYFIKNYLLIHSLQFHHSAFQLHRLQLYELGRLNFYIKRTNLPIIIKQQYL